MPCPDPPGSSRIVHEERRRSAALRRSRAGLFAALCACSAPPAAPSPRILAGEFSLAASVDGRSLALFRRHELLLRFPADAFELGTVAALDESASYDPYWLEVGDDAFKPAPPKDLRFRKATSATVRKTSDVELSLALSFEGGLSATLTLKSAAPGRFVAHLIPDTAPSAVAYVRMRPRASASEGFYGLGEWLDDVNHRGKLRPMQMEADLTLESANNEAHVPVPLLIGTKGWGLFVESRRVGTFDVARKEPDLIEITYGTAEESGKGLVFHLFGAEHPLDITRKYYDVTGDPLLPAPWALGPWIWRNENRDQAEVLDDVKKIRELDLATTAIWLDRPYASAVNTFDFNPTQFPDPKAMIQAIHDAGLRLALWSTPYLEKSAEPLLSEARSKGFFPPAKGVLLNRWGEPIDLTNPAAYAFWQEKIRRYTSMGIEGFKLDYAEDVVPGVSGGRNPWTFADGSDERTMHHGYTILYHRVYAETLPSTGGFLLCRAGRWGDQRYASVIWPGDLDATFTRYGETFSRGGKTIKGVGGLPASVVMGLSLGPSGFPFFGSDTGGYRHSPPSKELFIRWFQQTALSPVMQVGDASSEPPWVFTKENGRDQETLDLYRKYARLHLRLFPYLWTYAKNLARDGRPIARPLGLAYPSLGVHPADEYLLGDHLLVAPVVEDGARSRTVVLPPGEWVDFWDGTVLVGGGAAAQVAAPLDTLPLYLARGAIVPLLRPSIDTLSPTAAPDKVDSYATTAGVLHARVVPSTSRTEFRLFDGSVIAQDPTDPRSRLVLSVAAGEVFRFGALIEIAPMTEPESLEVDGRVVPRSKGLVEMEREETSFAWLASMGGTLLVKVPPLSSEIRVDPEPKRR